MRKSSSPASTSILVRRLWALCRGLFRGQAMLARWSPEGRKGILSSHLAVLACLCDVAIAVGLLEFLGAQLAQAEYRQNRSSMSLLSETVRCVQQLPTVFLQDQGLLLYQALEQRWGGGCTLLGRHAGRGSAGHTSTRYCGGIAIGAGSGILPIWSTHGRICSRRGPFWRLIWPPWR